MAPPLIKKTEEAGSVRMDCRQTAMRKPVSRLKFHLAVNYLYPYAVRYFLDLTMKSVRNAIAKIMPTG